MMPPPIFRCGPPARRKARVAKFVEKGKYGRVRAGFYRGDLARIQEVNDEDLESQDVDAIYLGAPYNGAPFNGALYIMAHHLMLRYIVSPFNGAPFNGALLSKRHFLTVYSVNKTLFETIHVHILHRMHKTLLGTRKGV